MYNSPMSTFQSNINIGNGGLTPIVDINNAPNSPCDIIVQNYNGNGIPMYLGNRFMWDQEVYGLKLEDGMSVSLALGPDDELYAFAEDNITITVFKTSGYRR